MIPSLISVNISITDSIGDIGVVSSPRIEGPATDTISVPPLTKPTGPAIAGKPGAPNAIYFLPLLVPAYKPNHAAPAPTTIDTNPDCAIVGSCNAMNHIVTLYNRYM